MVSIESGMRVRTRTALGTTRGLAVAMRYLDARRPGAEGMVQNCVPGHGGDVYWVEHGPGDVGAYSVEELEVPTEDVTSTLEAENARLRAVNAELLEACREALKCADTVRDKLRAAIARAEKG